ncbi:MAG TPA: RpiB/LacA/LacB family sugar-phosphate isomerase [Methylomirabilota bacterium]|jgi:ribose 5-phosphate isomerase B|nr:RpiB/LacA/LacB family sugar-phosphate isomerase [Methylomirabilota bacterium]
MKIYLGADHGGYKLKEEIKLWLKEWHFDFQDLGADNYTPEDDYPDYAWPVGVKVGSEQGTMGILACRSGQGEAIVANKAKGARAALAWNEATAHASRNDDDANILCLPADYVSTDNAKKIVHTFLTTKFDKKEERFVRRLHKVKKIDINL